MVYRFSWIKSAKAIYGICYKGFRRGEGQCYKSDPNINPLTKYLYPFCGEGVYLAKDFEDAETYTEPFYIMSVNIGSFLCAGLILIKLK